MKYLLSIRPAADADVDAAALSIAKDGIDAALRFYDGVDSTYREIRQHPQRWPRYELDHPRLSNLHKCAVRGFANWLVFYQIVGRTKIQIVRVLHGARDIPAALADELLD